MEISRNSKPTVHRFTTVTGNKKNKDAAHYNKSDVFAFTRRNEAVIYFIQPVF